MNNNEGEPSGIVLLKPQRQPIVNNNLASWMTDLPTNVSSIEQLVSLPEEFKSEDPAKPLQHVDDDTGEVFTYSLKPISYSVIFILLIELLERFSYYGLVYTQTSFLTGIYNDWSADMSALMASSYVSVGIAVAYTAPFLGALLADSFLGDYRCILVGCLIFYLPGLLLIDLTTIPYLLGDTFNTTLLAIGLLFLWPIGTGIVKSVINVFGARQYHPILQSSLIESYYVSFYMCINVGSLAGGLSVPIIAQHNITIAYMLPVVMLACGLLFFLAGSPRYTMAEPRGNLVASLYSQKRLGADSSTSLWSIFKVCSLIIPFNIVYSQQATMFIVQGTVMRKAFGFLDAASMNNADSFSVLLFGYLIGQKLYPWLATKNIKVATTHKFALGCSLGVLAILWSLVVEYRIHSAYQQEGETISILWQVPSYVLVGTGEIFAISTAYETAFTVSPTQKKALASAVNIFCVGGIPNVLCLMLYHVCSQWFQNAKGTGNIHTLETYSTAHIANYFVVLLGVAMLGVVINLLPSVNQYVKKLEKGAADAIRTPRMTPVPPRSREIETEATPLLPRRKPHEIVYHKAGSFLAGPFLQQDNDIVKKQMAKTRKGYILRKITSSRKKPTGKDHVKREESI